GTSPKCERTFTGLSSAIAVGIGPGGVYRSRPTQGSRMKRLSSPVRPSARLIVCTGLLLCSHPVLASDPKTPALAKATAQAAKSESSATSSPSIAEEKPLKPGKYDVNRIGQR